MQAWINITKDDEEIYATCPFCTAENNRACVVQFDDYVDYPMLWADCCGARAVLDPERV